MKHLLTAIACFFALSMSAQTDWPWNPDYDSDQMIGMTDFLPFLGIFGDEFVLEMPEGAPFTLALAYVGDYDALHCRTECLKRNGTLPTIVQLSLFEGEIDSLVQRESFTDPNLDVFSFQPQSVPVSPDPYNMQVALAANSNLTLGFADYHNLMLSANVTINAYMDLNGETVTIHEYLALAEVGSAYYSMYKQTCFCLGTIPND